MRIPFLKMHGLGNDFIVIDTRRAPDETASLPWAALADRRTGIGCDQFALLAAAENADIAMAIRNADGSPAGACGNAARCVAWLAAGETGRNQVTIAAEDRTLACTVEGRRVTVAMGRPDFSWQAVGLTSEAPTDHFVLSPPLDGLALPPAHLVSMGNPHFVCVVPEEAHTRLADIGPLIEHHPAFPERINVSFATPETRGRLRLTVWERGAGATRACGTAACAAVAAAIHQKLTDRQVEVYLPGGMLTIAWPSDADEIAMTGPASSVAEGSFDPADFREAAL